MENDICVKKSSPEIYESDIEKQKLGLSVIIQVDYLVKQKNTPDSDWTVLKESILLAVYLEFIFYDVWFKEIHLETDDSENTFFASMGSFRIFFWMTNS